MPVTVGGVLRSGYFAGIMLFVFSVGFAPLDDAAEVNLTAHMLQHVLIIFAGVMVAYPLIGKKMLEQTPPAGTWLPRLALVIAAGLIAFWHLPTPWDSAVVNPGVHVLEHLSFFTVGIFSGSLLLCLSDSGKVGALLLAFFGHMAYAVALISPWNLQIYSLYSIADQAVLGWVLLLTGPLLLLGVVYIFTSNPAWLSGYGGERKSKEIAPQRQRVPKWVPALLTLGLVISLGGYYGIAAYALGSTTAGTQGPVVSIYETPVSWQFSPSNITVVLGINSSVTWVSHSLSFDTVTSVNGEFSSGTMSPGSDFRFQFTKAGVYDYYCQFHPWMKGTVTVLSQSPGA